MVLPADHYVANVERYQQVCTEACRIAAKGHIVTLGIPPTRPETGYGYIQQGEARADGAFEVSAFKEKPDLATAATYLDAGNYVWNAGMFFMPCDLILAELERFEPELMAAIAPLADDDSPDTVAAVYPTLKSISIDYAVMEPTDKVVVIPGEFGWSDVGSWRSLYDFKREGDASFIRGDVIELDGGGNVLFSDGDGVIATVGVSDLVVVHTAAATMVCRRDEAQRLREIVEALKARATGRGDLL
jgi:mannose-1-phosphate guanylyltransferase/mannose-6-phosphate isomerase